MQGRFIVAGGIVHFRALVTLGSTSSMTGLVQVGLPVPASTAVGAEFGVGSVRDFSDSNRRYAHIVALNSATEVVMVVAAGGAYVQPGTPVVAAVGDSIALSGTYEPA